MILYFMICVLRSKLRRKKSSQKESFAARVLKGQGGRTRKVNTVSRELLVPSYTQTTSQTLKLAIPITQYNKQYDQYTTPSQRPYKEEQVFQEKV